MALSIMIQGTCSSAGKSIITAGLCRIFLEDGYSVAPFKAQNMALNSFVTADNKEMGRAQVTQAYACCKYPDVRMNPVLLKPSSETGSQVIVNGTSIGTMHFREYINKKQELKKEVAKAYQSLASENDIIVIEGAGSPAEINLKQDDIVNMHTARMAQAPVIIVGDIDRGGVFAHFIGTFECFDEEEKDLTKGFIINKFRGDPSLLASGIEYVEQKTNRKILGTVPFIRDLSLPDEDSVEFKKNICKTAFDPTKNLNLALVDLPHISNFTDFDPFLFEDDVNLFITDKAEDILKADCILLPGSKNSLEDAQYLYKKGFYQTLQQANSKNISIAGICGGYQLLGKVIEDPQQIESKLGSIKGLGFLDLHTTLGMEKILKQSKAVYLPLNLPVEGYEIHHGISESKDEVLFQADDGTVLGSINRDKSIWGTYIHGVFNNDDFRLDFLNKLLKNKNKPLLNKINSYDIEKDFTRLAGILRKHIDIDNIYYMMKEQRS